MASAIAARSHFVCPICASLRRTPFSSLLAARVGMIGLRPMAEREGLLRHLRCATSNPLLGFASPPAYLIRLCRMAEREGLRHLGYVKAPSLRLIRLCRMPHLRFATSNSVLIPARCAYLIRLCPMAEREGFEPSVPFPVHILSRDAQSATLSPLLGKLLNKLYPPHRSTEIEFYLSLLPALSHGD